MSRAFIDANVFLAQFEEDRHASETALDLIDSLDDGVTSTLVLAEVVSVATRRFGVPYRVAQDVLESIAARFECVDVPVARIQEGIEVSRSNRLDIGLLDAVHVASAIRSGCERMFTEDLAHNTWYGGSLGEVLVINPFKPPSPAPKARKVLRATARERANPG